MVDRAMEAGDEIGSERRIISDQPQPHALLVEGRKLPFEIEAHQAGKVGDLFAASSPVLGRESVEREDLDTVVNGGLHCPADSLGAGLVSRDARQASPGGPAAVAV